MSDDRFGDWSIDQKVFGWILSNLPSGSSILELGSGWATGQLARYYKMHSIENSSDWMGKFDTNYIFAPDTSGWYNVDVLKGVLPIIKYDLLLIDGPQHNKRSEIINHADLFNWKVPVIIDDTQEHDVMGWATSIATEFCRRPFEIIHGNPKSSMVIA